MNITPLFKFAVPVLASSLLHGAEYYVSPNGADNATGEINAPFTSIQRAFQVSGPGDKILLRGGIYRETIALVGKSGAP